MSPMRSVKIGAAVQLASASVPLDLPLNQWPMIQAHDSASGYLAAGRILHPINTWTITQPSDAKAAVTTQLNCGTRAFDWRPKVSKDGSLVMHHGSIEVSHAMADSVQEMLDWAASHTEDEDFLLLAVADCEGENCQDLAQQLLSDAGLPKQITDCDELYGMTMGQALELSKLPGGGHLLPVFGCLDMNYRPEVSCSGYSSGALQEGAEVEMYDGGPIGAVDASRGSYTCYGSNKDFPVNRMFSYLDEVSQAGPPSSGRVWSMQALWQENTDSVVIGDLHASSLLLDESKSKLNSLVTEAVTAGRFPHVNLLEVNNVCDGGPELLSALRARSLEVIV